MSRTFAIGLAGAATALFGFVSCTTLGFGFYSASAAGAPPEAIPGVPAPMLQAYVQAAAVPPPGCTGLNWAMLAGISQIESGHAAGQDISPTGDIRPGIFGPLLDGSGVGGNVTPFYDTDQGAIDGNAQFDRAVGPFQFIPGSWKIYGTDANQDGKADPQNAFDAAAAAAKHLCAGGRGNLSTPEGLESAILSYNHSQTYLQEVLSAISALQAYSSPGAAGSGQGAAVLAAAERWIGTDYSWGGGGPSGPSYGIEHGTHIFGFDCSGLTEYAYAQVGKQIGTTSRVQWTMGQRIPRELGLNALQPGDLVFYAYNPQSGDGIHHVGLYAGNGQMLNAPFTGAKVRYDPINLSKYAGGVRIP